MYLVGAAPFPSGGPNVTKLGAGSATVALDGASNAADLAVKNLAGLWDIYTTPTGVYWLTILKAGTPLLLIGFAFWAYTFILEWNRDRRKGFPWEKFLPLLLLVVLLSNNGFFLSGTVQVIHFIPQQASKAILDTGVNGITGRQRIQQTAMRNAYFQALRERLRQCVSVKDKEEYDKCANQAILDAKAQVDKLQNLGLPDPTKTDAGLIGAIGANFFSGIKMGMIGAFIGILTTLSYASHLFFGLILVLWASLAPVFTYMHLIPSAPNLKLYFSGFIGISLSQIFNAAFQVGAALMLATAGDWDPLIFPLIVGLLGFGLSLGVAYLGISGAYATIGAYASGASRLIRR